MNQPADADAFPSSYDAKQVDSHWYTFWEKNQLFSPLQDRSSSPFSIVMPPPNVTGNLHMGHAFCNILQDILVRYQRMCGKKVLWIPGTDHAGIATQTVVEKHLMKTLGKKRVDFSREVFLQHLWEWKKSHEHNILSQIKKLGCSCDWNTLAFTLDTARSNAVRYAFKKMFDDGLIYRGRYLVNWDPITQTALADDEVEYEEEVTNLWYVEYPIEGENESIVIATTRPETILADTAVAVAPQDERYHHLVGKKVLLPLTNRKIPIIADRHVDPQFGTGAVKITPAHDPHDYQIGLHHELEMINLLTPDGKMNENSGVFQGLSVQEARKKIVLRLEEEGFLKKRERHTHRVGISYRSKAVIEPYLSLQWFIKMQPLAHMLKEDLEKEAFIFIPSKWKNAFVYWIDNLRDWCISRQLWWGHRIPIWYRKDNPEKMICHPEEGTPAEVLQNPEAWIQEEDVLDTWFSSALWPFSTLGWPEKKQDLATFYPNSLLITGHDILFFWVARMLMVGKYLTGQYPFKHIYLHGLIYGKSYWRTDKEGVITYLSFDEKKELDLGTKPIPPDVQSKWEKLSKSKGNIIDPLEIIDEYGTDAMRAALCSSVSSSGQIDLDRRRFEEFKNFSNKIWNGSRFIFQHTADLEVDLLFSPLDPDLLGIEDKWILHMLQKTVYEVDMAITEYRFEHIVSKIYDFFWNDFCSYYLEITKPVLFEKKGNKEDKLTKQKVLLIVWTAAIRLFHPIAPFITEELFQRMKKHIKIEACSSTTKDKAPQHWSEELKIALSSISCSVAPYPHFTSYNTWSKWTEKEDNTWGTLIEIIYLIRNIRGEMKIPPGHYIDAFLDISKHPESKNIEKNLSLIEALVRIQTIYVNQPCKAVLTSTQLFNKGSVTISLPEDLIAQEIERLQKELIKLESSIQVLQTKLSNSEFLHHAPQNIVQKQQQLFQEETNKKRIIEEKLAKLG